ncbi:MAG: 50S ribosomal protein L23 [Candidatus Paceibacterota bacterium]
MALFGKDKKEKKEEKKETAQSQAPTIDRPEKGKRILLAPHVTEKAAILSDEGIYTFQIAGDASKSEVAQAVEEIYGVTPKKVRTVRLPGKVVRRRGSTGIRRRPKKAYVQLKKGDSIELF